MLTGTKYFYNKNEAAAAMGVSTYYVNRLIKTGRLKGVQLGQKFLISAESFHEFIATSVKAAK